MFCKFFLLNLKIIYIFDNIIVNLDKKCNIKNKGICLCGDNLNINFDEVLCWVKNNDFRKLRNLGYRNVFWIWLKCIYNLRLIIIKL